MRWGTNLSDPAQLQAAIYRYNHSATYVAIVLQWTAGYLTGVVPQPSAPGPVPPGTNGNGGRPTLIDSGPPAPAAPTTTPRPPSAPGDTGAGKESVPHAHAYHTNTQFTPGTSHTSGQQSRQLGCQPRHHPVHPARSGYDHDLSVIKADLTHPHP